MEANEVDIRRVVNRLLTTYSTRKDTDDIVGSFRWVFEGEHVTPQEFTVAATRYAKTGGRFFPTPGQILELIREERRTRGIESAGPQKHGYALWLMDRAMGRNDGSYQPCPICGATLTPADGGFEIVHDIHAHSAFGEGAFPVTGSWR